MKLCMFCKDPSKPVIDGLEFTVTRTHRVTKESVTEICYVCDECAERIGKVKQ